MFNKRLRVKHNNMLCRAL